MSREFPKDVKHRRVLNDQYATDLENYAVKYLSGPTNAEHLRIVVRLLIEGVQSLRERIVALEERVEKLEE